MTLNLEQVNELQLEEMKHALGLTRSKEPSRNSFYTEANNNSWNDLVEKGFATKHKGWEDDMAYFKVTVEAVQLICPNFKGIDTKKILR